MCNTREIVIRELHDLVKQEQNLTPDNVRNIIEMVRNYLFSLHAPENITEAEREIKKLEDEFMNSFNKKDN